VKGETKNEGKGETKRTRKRCLGIKRRGRAEEEKEEEEEDQDQRKSCNNQTPQANHWRTNWLFKVAETGETVNLPIVNWKATFEPFRVTLEADFTPRTINESTTVGVMYPKVPEDVTVPLVSDEVAVKVT